MRLLAISAFSLVLLATCWALPARKLKAPKNLHLERPQPRRIDNRLGIEFDELFDKLIDRIASFIVSNGLDPLALPDQGIEFTITDLLGIEWTTELSLKTGWLTDLSLFQRDGDATLQYVNDTLNVFSVGLVFPGVSVMYDFTAKLMNIGPSGSINAKAVDLRIWLDINIDVETKQLSLGQYTITDAGTLDVSLQGGTIVDWIANGIIDIFTWLFQDVLLGVVEDTVRPVLAEGLSKLTVQDVLDAAGVGQSTRH